VVVRAKDAVLPQANNTTSLDLNKMGEARIEWDGLGWDEMKWD
jgi:hypothetical protein